ncbi:MAG: sialidase family protein [Armatimonadota bacterium]|nr:sialidase family protein [Armatimonadota bacterium]
MVSPTNARADDDGPEVIEEGGLTKIRLLPPGEDNPRNSEGDFVTLEDGQIMFVYTHFTGTSGSDFAPAHLAARYSSDGGYTWTDEDVTVVPNEGANNVMSVSMLRLQDGRIALFYCRKNSNQDCHMYMRTSTDEAQTWSEPQLCIPEDGYFVVNNDRVMQLDSGRLIVPAARHNEPGGEWHGGIAMCFFSDDAGETWHKSNEILPPEGLSSGLQEPGVIALRDGRLMMLCRTSGGCQYRSYSQDDGETWSPAQPTGIISPVSPATFERIPQTGDILMAWNDHSDIDPELEGKRTPYTVAISRDEGQTWENVKVIDDDPMGWYCYTAMHFVEDHVLLGHCAGDRRVMGGLDLIQITIFDVDWLYE